MKAVIVGLLFIASALALPAGVIIGSPRVMVIATYGEPKGSTKAGNKEILVYPSGRVWLEDGVVVRLERAIPPGDNAAVGSTPRSAGAPVASPTPMSAPRAVTSARNPWLTDFAAAQAEAAAKKKRLLVLFTGSDWCPPCMDFEAKVAHNSDFLDFARVSFVLVKLDYPRSTFQSPALQQQNEALRRKYGVNAYPTLMVMSTDGEKTLRVDTRKSRPVSNKVDYFLQAVDEARKAFDQPKSWWWPF